MNNIELGSQIKATMRDTGKPTPGLNEFRGVVVKITPQDDGSLDLKITSESKQGMTKTWLNTKQIDFEVLG